MKKKKIIIIVAAALAVITLGLCFKYLIKPQIPPTVVSLSEQKVSTEGVNLIAHRGFSAIAPENSAAAFICAGEQTGFYAAECDIQLTADGFWVLNHNDTIDKMTNGEGRIDEMLLYDIQQYTVDNGHYAKDYPNQKLITLEEYLSICKEFKMKAQIEIKSGNYAHLEDILKALKESEMLEDAIIISFDGVVLEKLRNLDNTIEMWYLTHEISNDAIKLCEINGYTLAFNHKKYDKEQLIKAQNKNIPMAAWTVDSVKAYEELYELGIRNFTTNCLTN